MNRIKIGNKTISEGNRTFIIAEAGINHEGKMGTAVKLVREAKRSGADAIKFQTLNPDAMVNKSLLPETYNFTRGETRQDLLIKMQQAMSETLDALWQARTDAAPVLSRGEIVILASIVEKETAVPDERRRIAGVFINRLNKGIPLQTDPTVIYAITGGKIRNEGQGPLGRRLLSKDLKFESPYNTYKYPGLPPGPIANPGRAALAAVLDPEKNEYYYFVANGSGGHVFSKTLEEHNRNAANWRKIRKQQGN